ncbi:septal ring lytic transglycosylase RlpA family protein [Lentzea aerocolonigenes]|uniref:septal ring lytic transglycosylase RlpA family protein n=1 Tax=Lentzea aerocolonigenes TaxID=68170 RepID=UPI0007C77B71|nr:septal ring lytic transglycosylase RlpA family protein [Lentzea aerocolonigenes]
MAKTLAAAGLTLASLAATAVLFTPVASAETCKASYYSGGGTTASGERFDPNKLTAAHKTLPFGTKVKVKNRSNGKTVTVRINDRGPFVTGRCIDLTPKAFKAIAPLSQGVVGVTVNRV